MTNLDFLNLNTIRNYPIKDGLDRTSSDAVLTIPNDLIADLSISVPNNDSLRIYISKIVNTSTNVSIEISANSIGVVGIFNIPTSGITPYQDFRLTSSAVLPNSLGVITIGSLDSILSAPSGEFSFSIESTELLMRIYAPSTTGVNYLAFSDSKGNRSILTGYVNILAESNLQFRTNGSTIILDAGENLGLNKVCDDTGVPIKSINGVKPDSEGNFYLIPSDCASIEPVEFGLVLKDTCGKPCLGCNEIGTLTDRLVTVESDLLKVRDYVNNLQGLITQLTTLINYQCQCE